MCAINLSREQNLHCSSIDIYKDFSSVTQVHLTLWYLWLQHARLPPLSITNTRTLLKLMPIKLVMSSNLLILHRPFSSRLQSFSASESFQMSQFFASGGQSIKSFSFNISPSSEYSVLISFRMDWLDLLAVQGTVFSNITVQKHQFFGAQLSLWSNSHIHTWLLEPVSGSALWTWLSHFIFLGFNLFFWRMKVISKSYQISPIYDSKQANTF